MNKRKGFTLVELLAVIVILAIVLIIAVPGVLSIINKTKNNAYDRQIDMIKDAAKNYVTANSVTWSGDNPKSTLVTLDMLQSGGYLDKKIIDPRNKKEILCANVLVTRDNKNKITYDVNMTCNEIQPITPRVGSGMIPIVYKDGNWVKADASNKNFAWFNYGNQQWANVATVTEDVRQTLLDAPVDTIVPMDKINAMFTWIPRFKYKLFNVDGTVSPVGNPNMLDDYMIDIKFETASTTKSTGTQNGQWLTHPAFTFGGEELEGFWVGKFMNSNMETENNTCGNDNTCLTDNVVTKVGIVPNRNIWRNQSIANSFTSIINMKNPDNPYGLSSSDDPHMIKNMEWGAMAYLTNSKYGKQGNDTYSRDQKEVRLNNTFTTGGGDYQTNIDQSTTGNITGVYDTAGGAWEYTMAIWEPAIDGNGDIASSEFDSTVLKQYISEGKYIDSYNYEIPTDGFPIGKLGDATTEMGPITQESYFTISSWYKDFAFFAYVNRPWFSRGGKAEYLDYSGINAFAYSNGKIGWNDWKSYGSRTILK